MVAVGPDAGETETVTDAETAAAEALAAELAPDAAAAVPWDTGDEAEEPLPGRFAWVVPTLALLAVAGWTGFFGWVNRDALLAGASPAQWSRWIVDWAVPVVLVVGLWLLAMRHSRREAYRFAGAARALSQESRALETRLATVNRELSLAREFIAAQSRDLESLGRLASERLSQNAAQLQSLIRDNGDQVEAIGRVSETALSNMARLRDDLPVIANSARDVTSQIAHAGETAQGQLEALDGGFIRLGELGEASGERVLVLGAKVDEAMTALRLQAEQFEETMTQRFTELAQRSNAFRAELDGREVEAFAAMRRRIDALTHEVGESRSALTMMEQAALTALGDRLARFTTDSQLISERLRANEAEHSERWTATVEAHERRMLETIERVSDADNRAIGTARERLEALREASDRLDEAIAQRISQFEAEADAREAALAQRERERIAALEARLAALDATVSEREEQHVAHVAMLAERSEALAERLGELGRQIGAYAGEGQQAHESLSESAAALAARLADNRATLAESQKMVAGLTDDSVRLLELIRSSSDHAGEGLPQAIGQAEARLGAFEEQTRSLGALIAEAGEKGALLAAHVASARSDSEATRDELAAHEARLAELAARSSELAERARSELGQAVETLEAAANKALGGLQEQQAAALRGSAEQLGAESGETLARAMRERTEDALAGLEDATRKANEAAREAALHLRDQLSRVNELTGNLEQRIAHARQRAEEQVDNDFTRRMALITESLNSSAIDITKVFDSEVSDTAWASYLRGDRGIFTRRAVRLLSAQDAKAFVEIYSGDAEFRETVNRYIHDFEAMLRTVLSTRDGHALAVTLLSSDMGKLYVAMAQAIERLRT